MAKSSRITNEDSIFAKGVKAALGGVPAMPEMPKAVTIREADGGYIVSSYDSSGPRKDKVYESIDGVHACIDEKFGQGKKKKKKYEEGE